MICYVACVLRNVVVLAGRRPQHRPRASPGGESADMGRTHKHMHGWQIVRSKVPNVARRGTGGKNLMERRWVPQRSKKSDKLVLLDAGSREGHFWEPLIGHCWVEHARVGHCLIRPFSQEARRSPNGCERHLRACAMIGCDCDTH